MENTLILNNTPITTSRNFGINNIKLENIYMPKVQKEFNNIKLEYKNSIISQNPLTSSLTYGTGLEEYTIKNSNHNLKIETNSNQENIILTYTFDNNNLYLTNNIDITVKGQANIIIKYESNTNKACMHSSIIRILAKENSSTNIFIINLLNHSSNHFEAIENTLEENSKINYTIIDLGAKNSVINYYSNVIGNNSENSIKSIYLGMENQIKDLNYISHLRGEKSVTDIDIQGALKDNAKKHFKGTIDFKSGCKKAKGSENEYCMLLSDKARSMALPILLCTEDDVEGSHSTAAGKVEQEILFYIMSRGICYKDAIKMIVRARFNKIIETIPNEDLKNQILNEIDLQLS